MRSFSRISVEPASTTPELHAARARLVALRAKHREALDGCASALAALRLAVDHALSSADAGLAAALVERELALHADLQHHDEILRELDALDQLLAARMPADAPGRTQVARSDAGRAGSAGDGGANSDPAADRHAQRRALRALRKALTTLGVLTSTS